MKKFRYQGPVDSSVTLRLADGKEIDVMFYRGQETIPLPPEHDYIKTLLALQHLVPLAETVATDTAPPAKVGKTVSKEGSE